MDFPKYLNVNEAADRLGVSVSYLNKLRLTDGGGPLFVKMGARVCYDPADLAAWAESQKQRSMETRMPSLFPLLSLIVHIILASQASKQPF